MLITSVPDPSSCSVVIGDCLSRLIDNSSMVEDDALNLQIADLGVENVNIDWQNIRKFMMIDPTLVRLAKVIQGGWPETSKELPIDVKPYFQHQYKLHIVDDALFYQHRIMVPVGLRCGFLDKLHDNHMGIAKTRLLARTLIYWPNWNDDIKRVCSGCEICKENQNMPANVPKFQVIAHEPGEIYGIDVAEIEGNQHLVCVDYYSCCIFERKLASVYLSILLLYVPDISGLKNMHLAKTWYESAISTMTFARSQYNAHLSSDVSTFPLYFMSFNLLKV